MKSKEIFEILSSFSNYTASFLIEEEFNKIGKNISKIINKNEDELTDGQCLDFIIDYLTTINLYNAQD